MGFFSWITSDTKESASNSFSSRIPTTVYLLQPHGEHIREDNYEGYGVFGGKDVFVQWMKWNHPSICQKCLDDDAIRNEFFDKFSKDTDGGRKNCKYPIKIASEPVDYDSVDASEDCPNQGYFYGTGECISAAEMLIGELPEEGE